MRRFKVVFVPNQASWGIRYYYLWPLFRTMVPHVWETKKGAEMAMALLESGKSYEAKKEQPHE